MVFHAVPRQRTLEEVGRLAHRLRREHPEVVRVGLFGSYARGDHAPESDVDLLLLVRESAEPCWFRRSLAYDVSALPVPADVFVYTMDEARRMLASSPWFRHVHEEAMWFNVGEAGPGGP